MSRSGYVNDDDSAYPIGLYRHNVRRAMQGMRGQAMLRELLAVLDAMPKKSLITEQFELNGEYCTLGVLCHAKGVDMSEIDPTDYYHTEDLAQKLNVSPCLVREVAHWNDACGPMNETPHQRWVRMRQWVDEEIDS